MWRPPESDDLPGLRSRREFLAGVAAAAVSAALSPAFAGESSRTRLILLGTKGGPRLTPNGGPNCSLVLLIDGAAYLVDVGYGASRQLLNAGIPLQSVRYLFITHHHSDHNLEYGPLLYNAWATGSPGHVDAYGPPGLKKMTEAFHESMKVDIETRVNDEGRPDPRTRVTAHEISGPGLVMKNDAVRVTAAVVPHPQIKHAFAYRFDAADRSIVISGDTAYSPALGDFAKGADVLVHEVMHPAGIEDLLKRVPNAARLRRHLIASHTIPEDVGRVAARAGVKTLVLYHFVPPDTSFADEEWAAGVRRHFKGRIIVGKDLMEI
jgi:ribonuclease BN (tRNA processing enzyme)